MIRLDALTVWGNREVRERLGWYYAVMKNRKPAKFLMCKKIPCRQDFVNASYEELWAEHDRLSDDLKHVQAKVNSDSLELAELETPRISFMDLKAEMLRRIMKNCLLCEWRCKVDRAEGKRKGACKLDTTTRVSTWFHHFGEEAPLVGSGGSGTIFFTSCTFRCVFCQNWDISQDAHNGAAVNAKQLSIIMKSLRESGALNINFVGGEPTPQLHTIVDGMRLLETNVPMLWNSNMYCSIETMKILSDVIDIWLPDFKYGNDKCAVRLSRVINYFDVVSRNHRIAHENGDIIIRHLVMPNHIECCTKPILDWIAENCPRALVNVMGQYHPDNIVPSNPEKYGDISRRLTRSELQEAYNHAEELGIIYEPVS